jgi:predicted transcriptional regulator YdeE
MSNQPETVKQVVPISRQELPELLFIGMIVNVSFKHGDFSRIGEVKEAFMRRREEIQNVVDPDHYYAPWYSCEVMFTYFFCMQVSSLEQVPEGMMGFSVPAHMYLKAKYDGAHPLGPDPYGELQRYRAEHGLKEHPRAMVIEKYTFANEGREGLITVDVFAPIE